MKKLIALVLLCSVMLSGCGMLKSEPTPPVTESKTVYFVNFGSVEGKSAAVAHVVDTVNGEYVDSEKEEVYTFADDAVLESFDLKKVSVPTETSIEKMELARFKEAALLLKAESPIVYKVEVAEGKIYAARSELKFFPEEEPAEVLCPKCTKWFKEGVEFDTHDCQPAPTPTPSATPSPSPTPTATPAPTATPKPTVTEAPRTKQCPVCEKWYSEKDYLYHQCVGYNVQCPQCKNWYMAGYDFLTHKCGTSQAVRCGACGITFDSKQAYDNHKCQAAGGQTCYGCGQYFATVYAYDTHSCPGNVSQPTYTQCAYCGIWLTEGNEYRNHVLSCAGNQKVYCSDCGITFDNQNAYDNHHCQGTGGQTCYGCGQYFATVYEFDTHSCPGNNAGQSGMVQCEYCGQWLYEGSDYRNHMLSLHY